MAIAFDNSSSGTGSGTSLTVAHTCAGSERILLVYVFSGYFGGGSGDRVTGVTYNGVAMTLIKKVNHGTGGNEENYLFYLLNPASGNHNIVVSASVSLDVSRLVATSYKNVLQSGQPDSFTSTGPTTSTSITSTTTTCR